MSKSLEGNLFRDLFCLSTLLAAEEQVFDKV